MIITPFESNDGGTHIFVRYRHERAVREKIVKDFSAYFFVSEDEIERLRVVYDERYYGWSIGEKTPKSLDGRPLIQIMAPSPSDVKGMRNVADESWEGDIHYPDRFAIDTFNGDDAMPDWFPYMVRAGGFDMEWNEDGAITALGFTVDGNTVMQWAWHPKYPIGGVEVTNEYCLTTFSDERTMLMDFATAFQALNPDLITTWSGNRADWPKLYERLKHHQLSFDFLSPIPDSATPPMTHLPRSGFYDDGTQVLLGRMTVDLADRNHGFERVWKDSGNGQLGDRRLGSVLKEAFPDNPEWWKVDMDEEMTHHELWLNHFDDFLRYHRGDIIGTDRLDREYHVTRFFMALQRVCGVSFSSVFTVSRFARGLLRRKATWAAPTGSYNNKLHKSYGGGFVADPKGGRHEWVAVFDFAAMYAEIQRAYNISPETLIIDPEHDVTMNEDIAITLENDTAWDHRTVGVLPQLQIDLAAARNDAKAEMKKHEPESTEYAGFNTLQLAFKRAAASVYGLMGHTGHGESHRTVAATITFVGRSLTTRLMEVAEEMGFEALAGHTDSIYVAIGEDADGEKIADDLTQIIQGEFKSERFVVEYEKLMKSWVAASSEKRTVKNRNFGWVVWPKEGLHCTGFELKKSNASLLTKAVQEGAFTAMCYDVASEDDLQDLITQWILSVRGGTVKREAMVMRSRLSKNPEKYNQNGGFQGAAKRYNQHVLGPKHPDRYRAGDSVSYTYTTSGITAFKTEKELAELDLDYTTIIQKQIIAPVSLIFEAMGWRMPTSDGSRPQGLW